MKTQINNLQRGHGRFGVVGTSYEVRSQIAAQVKSENPEGMTVQVGSHIYHLHYIESQSGKSFCYTTDDLPIDDVRQIVPFDGKAIANPELVRVCFRINQDMTCEYVTSRRVKTTRQWKSGQTIEVAEKNVLIL